MINIVRSLFNTRLIITLYRDGEYVTLTAWSHRKHCTNTSWYQGVLFFICLLREYAMQLCRVHISDHLSSVVHRKHPCTRTWAGETYNITRNA